MKSKDKVRVDSVAFGNWSKEFNGVLPISTTHEYSPPKLEWRFRKSIGTQHRFDSCTKNQSWLEREPVRLDLNQLKRLGEIVCSNTRPFQYVVSIAHADY
ncbi:hypothetical protein, partial [Vibrio parahaemolyticus]|uniref:hypothetical protein n=1 Tax=Vibrio parahaemolyticus TaxID=670 RepID=UPI0019D6F8C9